jgi:hypothetical protein
MHRLRRGDGSPTGSQLYSFSLGVDNDLSIGAYVLQNTTPIAVMYTPNITLAESNSTNSTNSSGGVSCGRERRSMLALLGIAFAAAMLLLMAQDLSENSALKN